MTDKYIEGFIEQICIQIFVASMFSYFVGKTFEWTSLHWTTKMYGVSLWLLDFATIKKLLEVFVPIAIIFLIDVVGFIFFAYKFWIKARKIPIRCFLDALVQILVSLPIGSWPWAVFHLSVPFLGDNRLAMHFCFFLVYMLLCGIALFLNFLAWKPKTTPTNVKNDNS